MERTPAQRRIVAVYISTSALYTLATSVIWGVNTLFLMHAGLSILQVMLVNAAFTVGQLVFEVPTGVVADTIGRKASLLLGVATLLVSTLLYVGAARYGWGMPIFVLASVLIGLGFTFQTGAGDAWLVDALDSSAWEGPKDRVFAWGGMTFGASMLVGTLLGGVLGQVDLDLPYVARAAILGVCFVAMSILVRDVGFTHRKLRLVTFGEETRRILAAGTAYGWRHRVVRPLMFVSLSQGIFFLFAFYSLQPYLLDMLRLNLVWFVAAVTAASSVVGMVGNALVEPVMRKGDGRRRPARVLAAAAAAQTLLAIAIGLVGVLVPPASRGVGPTAAIVALFLAFSLVKGIADPVRQAFINGQIPSEQRATVLSLDSFFADVGGAAGQPALGYLAQVVSIPVGWIAGALGLAVSAPLYVRADSATGRPDDAA